MDLAEVLKEWLDHRREVLIRRSKHRLARDRPPSRSARRPAGRLSQPRQGHQDHPQRGRAQARPDQDLQAHRRAGRRHPQHAAAQLAQARRDGDQDREQGAGARRRPASRSCCAPRRSSGERSPIRSRRSARRSARRRRSASAAPISPRRPSTTRPRSKRPWWCASRSPSWCRRRAGSARCAAIRPTFPGSRSRPTTGRSSPSRRRPRRRFWCSRPTAASTPSTPRSCRAAAATASRCGSTPTWSRTPSWFPRSAIRAAASSWWRARPAAASWWPRTKCLANTRKGKQVLNVKPPDAARAVAPVEGEMAAAVGENRKMVIFPLDQVPEMARGRGVRLQRHKDGGLSDVTTFKGGDGLNWVGDGGRVSNLSLKELAAWRGNRGDAGRVRPDRFLANLKFGRLAGERQERRRERRDSLGRISPVVPASRDSNSRQRLGPASTAATEYRSAQSRRSGGARLTINSPRTRSSGRIFPGSRSRFRRRTASRRGGARRPSR